MKKFSIVSLIYFIYKTLRVVSLGICPHANEEVMAGDINKEIIR